MQTYPGSSFRSLFLTLLIAGSSVGQQQPEEYKKLVTNEQFGFSFRCPGSWSVDRGRFPDPLPDLEAFKTGKVALEGSLGKPSQGEENGARLNAVKPTRDGGELPPPTIEIFVHSSPAKSCDQFTSELKQLGAMFGQHVVSAHAITTKNKLEGCDVVYTTPMGSHEVFSRMTVFFKNGRRYILSYFEPNEADFRANAKAFEDVLHSFAITK